ncbi:hypothetical protein LTR56_013130 [Elasticomyces elasticus]|nr:hypothetical protein LTR56_013130 [Elasticomyces elasticus]KAK3656694.1 hypothetical protein LTR22_009673 [Elasticomyces elasticus]KAK4921566.1 hypothetical protein LTR49_011036 [Elasticomyces elasticus]KAK5760254.1 hypothetical protein LTS12_009638 [Elasticomyces elasticus]
MDICHLLRLPRELRDEITLLVVTDTITAPCYQLVDSVSDGELMGTQCLTGPKQPGLSLTCRLFREEALTLYYGENKFNLLLVDIAQELPPPKGRSDWWLTSPIFLALERYSLSAVTIVVPLPLPPYYHPMTEPEAGSLSVVSEGHERLVQVICEGGLDNRCCCRIYEFVEGMNAYSQHNGEKDRRIFQFLQWMVESMMPLLEEPYEEGTECLSCGKLGSIQRLTPATDSVSPSKLGLLGLPQEIRDEIYRLVVIDGDTPQSYVLDARDDDWQYLLPQQRFRGALQPALSCVCRDLRDEVLAIFYNEHRLLFDVSDEPGIAPLAPRVQNWWLTSPAFLAASRYKASDVVLHISVSAPLYARPGDPDPTGVETDDAVLLLEYRAGIFALEVGGDDDE